MLSPSSQFLQHSTMIPAACQKCLACLVYPSTNLIPASRPGSSSHSHHASFGAVHRHWRQRRIDGGTNPGNLKEGRASERARSDSCAAEVRCKGLVNPICIVAAGFLSCGIQAPVSLSTCEIESPIVLCWCKGGIIMMATMLQQ